MRLDIPRRGGGSHPVFTVIGGGMYCGGGHEARARDSGGSSGMPREDSRRSSSRSITWPGLHCLL
jgi:hypothetical protein